MRKLSHKFDFCVVGGGIAGLCAAISAARHGAKTAIMHERPVFGGNSSSEIRVPYRSGVKSPSVSLSVKLPGSLFISSGRFVTTSLSALMHRGILSSRIRGLLIHVCAVHAAMNSLRSTPGRTLPHRSYYLFQLVLRRVAAVRQPLLRAPPSCKVPNTPSSSADDG